MAARLAIVVARLRALVETVPVDGTGVTVTNRSTEEVVLRCTRVARDVYAALRATGTVDEQPTGHREVLSCAFDPREHEGPLPRPVADVLTPSFFLDEGAGIATDALYDDDVSERPQAFVAREPGGPDPR